MDFTEENIEKAIHQFYHDAGSQQEINRWLTAAQISPQAWHFPWQLLDASKGPEVQFFGASCLHVKISRYWHEIQAEQIAPLRGQLFDLLITHATGSKMVLTRICVVLSAFAMQTMPEVWPDAVQTMINAFAQENLQHLQPGLSQVLLELLTVLPEEYHTTHFSQQRKGLVRNELQRSLVHVTPVLQKVMAPTSPGPMYEQALRCYASWAQFGIPLSEGEPLVLQAFQALHDETVFDTAIDALVNVFSHYDNCRYPQSMQRLLSHLLKLREIFALSIEEGDTEKCQSLVRLIVAAATDSTRLLLSYTLGDEPFRQLALDLVNLVLECSAIPGFFPVDECCSDLCFTFWYTFQDDLIAAESSQYQVLAAIYRPVYMSLMNVMLRKCQLPPDEQYDTWGADEKEQHRCYREDISDTLMYAYNLLREPLLADLCKLFAAIVERSAAEQVRWEEVEAVLFALSSIADSVGLDENKHLPSLFRMLGQVPCTHPKLVSQALNAIGAYADWIGNHPELLGSVLPPMLQGVKDPTQAQTATLSLKLVLNANQQHLLPFVAQILTASKDSLDNAALRPRDAHRLMACLGYTLSVLPVNEIMEYLDVLLSPHIEQLLRVGTMEPTVAAKSTILVKIEMLTWLVGSLNIYWETDDEEAEPRPEKPKPQGPQPVLLIMQKVLPVFKSVLEIWVVDPGVVEAVCETVKKALRTLMDEFAHLADDVTQLVVQMYSAVPQQSVLDLAKKLMVLYATEEGYRPTAALLFHSVCNRTLAVYEAGIRDHPDLAAEFMSFLSQIAKKNQIVFMSDGCNILGLFQAGVISLGMPENPTVKAACSFLSELISLGGRNPAVQDIVLSNGGSLVDRLMRAIGGEAPRVVVDSMSDVFLALNKHCFDQLCAWLNGVVERDGFPCPRAARADKEQFARRILKERTNKRRLREIVTEYTLLWRGLIGTEYAAQTANVR